MYKIGIIYLIYYVKFILSCASDYSSEQDGGISEQKSLEIRSEDNEVYNTSSKEKPYRVKSKLVNSTEYYDDDVDEANKKNMKYQNCIDHEEYSDEENRCRSTLVNYPYAVSVQRKGSHYASGALLDKKWILTTGAEFYHIRESIKLFRARLGSVDCKRGGTLVPLKSVHVHPSFVFRKPSFDIALLRMGASVDFSDFIKPIRLSVIKEQVLSAKLMTTYWPKLIVKGHPLPPAAKERVKFNSMRVSTQRLIPWDYCFKLMKIRNESLLHSSLCLKPIVTHHSPCMPDVGAPVVAEDGLWGITSGWTSENCMTNSSPTIFTRVSASLVRSWLDSNLISASSSP